ncbi:MAG: cupredoxin domain-containing protein [Nitrosomonas sp.]|uniref:cupredoxin domain-containing protein n=1 Tax=Nitrosomonas sp. TaxID=42353 RepID=UPI00272F1722|nr:cupredoxin domain-containing protein [Nitrosomonas sp.]MDP2224192.1 cupredoxin domain-containing protein [Nitrosomonas sp.]MDP3280368.1 cupredoxin domain-containing protein [Nitrosomonas sp.]
MYRMLLTFLFSTFVLFSYTAFAETNQSNDQKVSIGKPGEPSNVSRTINLTLLDNMFLPPELTVRKDETIRFVLKNLGNNTHEFLIGSEDELKKAASMKRKNEHLIRVKPGEQKELIWEFTNMGIVNFACPLSEHFKTMKGKIIVKN